MSVTGGGRRQRHDATVGGAAVIEAIVKNGRTGIIVPPNDRAALAAAMRSLLESSHDELQQMGRPAREVVVQQYSIDATVSTWEARYQKLLTAARRERRFAPIRRRPRRGRARVTGRGR